MYIIIDIIISFIEANDRTVFLYVIFLSYIFLKPLYPITTTVCITIFQSSPAKHIIYSTIYRRHGSYHQIKCRLQHRNSSRGISIKKNKKGRKNEAEISVLSDFFIAFGCPVPCEMAAISSLL